MAIPHIFHQTYKSHKLPLLAPMHIARLKAKNPGWQYCFYTDDDVDTYIRTYFGSTVHQLYSRIQIGAAKADFFRYCVMLQHGGIYLDVDSLMLRPAASFLLADDVAVISHERNPGLYVQWALIFAPGHPFMQRTLELCCHNIKHNTHPHNVHSMTGPGVYSQAINSVLTQQPHTRHRVLGTDYMGHFKFKYFLSRLNFTGSTHWRKEQAVKPVLKPL